MHCNQSATHPSFGRHRIGSVPALPVRLSVHCPTIDSLDCDQQVLRSRSHFFVSHRQPTMMAKCCGCAGCCCRRTSSTPKRKRKRQQPPGTGCCPEAPARHRHCHRQRQRQQHVVRPWASASPAAALGLLLRALLLRTSTRAARGGLLPLVVVAAAARPVLTAADALPPLPRLPTLMPPSHDRRRQPCAFTFAAGSAGGTSRCWPGRGPEGPRTSDDDKIGACRHSCSPAPPVPPRARGSAALAMVAAGRWNADANHSNNHNNDSRSNNNIGSSSISNNNKNNRNKKRKKRSNRQSPRRRDSSSQKSSSSSSDGDGDGDGDGRERMRQAEEVEAAMLLALEETKSRVKEASASKNASASASANDGGSSGSSDGGSSFDDATATATTTTTATAPAQMIAFPSARECNAALAALGDAGELLRALRLFGKMRKAAALSLTLRRLAAGADARISMYGPVIPPAPTLVTYSTLMSRAIYLGKAPVALRLWKLMKSQAEFFRNNGANAAGNQRAAEVAAEVAAATEVVTTPPPPPPTTTTSPIAIVPDVKAANILMNAYAKLGDYESALDLMHQMTSEDGGDDVPPIPPNLVTWNTLVDACHRAGDLSAALDVYDAMKSANVRPDARTCTSLISTVARRSSLRGGAKDPSPAFALFEEMRDRYGVQPNGMTYCALIDVCGRCQRSDLALKGLRMMLRQKEEEGRMVHQGMRGNDRKPPSALYNEVGAWTAAIDACGRAGRIDTALKLFSTMRDKFGVMPNTVTCGCITDILLRAGRTTEALDILRFMKEAGIEPSEVMYTSLMTSAGRMARKERRDLRRHQGGGFGGMTDEDLDEAEATEVYTELMSSLLEVSPSSARKQQRKRHKSSKRQGQSDSNAVLLRVFLVFQEMLASGVKPDLACYNSLLRACSRSGDIARMTDVMKRIASDGLDPNEVSWRQLIKGAARAERSDLAEQYWNDALSYVGRDDGYIAWTPNTLAFEGLIDAYMREAAQAPTHLKKLELYAKVVSAYEDVLYSEADRGMSEIDVFELHENPRVMLAVLRAAVSLELAQPGDDSNAGNTNFRSSGPKELASNIATLESLQQRLSPQAGDAKTMKALNLAKVWAYQGE